MNEMYKNQFKLLLQIIPFITEEPQVALKGGTAINLFIRNLPRLSVDIDLAYLPFDDRITALKNITKLLQKIKIRLQKKMPKIKVQISPNIERYNAKLFCISPEGFRIKIEVNTVMRGHLFEPRLLPCVRKIKEDFNSYIEARILSQADLYGSKICASLDRQHPRDLFDIFYLLKNEGITKHIKFGFISSLLSHNRPIHEILNPSLIDQKQTFINQFSGMSLVPFSYQEFENTRRELIEKLHTSVEDNDKKFLLSFKAGNPQWKLLPKSKLKDLPAIKWKLKNLKKLIISNPEKHKRQYENLKETLYS